MPNRKLYKTQQAVSKTDLHVDKREMGLMG